jgi:hypothetical protein
MHLPSIRSVRIRTRVTHASVDIQCVWVIADTARISSSKVARNASESIPELIFAVIAVPIGIIYVYATSSEDDTTFVKLSSSSVRTGMPQRISATLELPHWGHLGLF